MKPIPIIVPDGQSGEWRVETFKVTPREASFANLRASIGNSLEAVEAGTYKRLVRSTTTVMSNTPMELDTNRPIIHAAKGNVLINGLGLGMVLSAILGKVNHITVIEKSPDVIKLVRPSFVDPRITIIEADAMAERLAAMSDRDAWAHLLRAEGYPNTTIGERLGCSARQIGRIFTIYRKTMS